MGKKKYIIEVDDKYVMGTLYPQKLLMPVSLGIVGDDKNEWLVDTGFELTSYVEPPEEPKEQKRPYKVGDIIKNHYDNRIVVITYITDNGMVTAMDADGCFHTYHPLNVSSTELWLSLKVLQKLEGEKNE